MEGMSSIAHLSVSQLRKAATLKEQIQSLENELGRILGSSAKPVAGTAPKKKSQLSAAARTKMAAAAKARWVKVKAKKVAVKSAPKVKGRMSAAGRARISAAAKARWAKAKAAGRKTL